MGHLQTAIIQLITWAQVHDSSLPPPPPPPNKLEWNVLLTLLKLSYSQSVYSNIRHPYEGQLTAVNLKHPLTIIAWLYRGLIFLSSSILLKFSADIWFDFGLNYVFLERETQENSHQATHLWRVFLIKIKFIIRFFNFNISFIELDIRFSTSTIVLFDRHSFFNFDIRFIRPRRLYKFVVCI